MVDWSTHHALCFTLVGSVTWWAASLIKRKLCFLSAHGHMHLASCNLVHDQYVHNFTRQK